jgi:hypothetical protein
VIPNFIPSLMRDFAQPTIHPASVLMVRNQPHQQSGAAACRPRSPASPISQASRPPAGERTRCPLCSVAPQGDEPGVPALRAPCRWTCSAPPPAPPIPTPGKKRSQPSPPAAPPARLPQGAWPGFRGRG